MVDLHTWLLLSTEKTLSNAGMELHNIYPLRSLPYLAYDNVNPEMVISMMLRSSMPAFEKVYTP